jgi:hypothetical protein
MCGRPLDCLRASSGHKPRDHGRRCYPATMAIRSHGCWLGVALAASSMFASGVASADGAAAQVLWDEARAHIKDGDYASACPKFAESHRLDPQLGTLMNLANCYAEVGKVASAWAKFVEASEMATARKDKRAKEASRRASELEPKLVRMELVVAESVEGMVIRRDDELIAEALWGSAVPVDPGVVTIEVKALGYQSWAQEVDLTAEGETIRVEIPPLETLPDEVVDETPGAVGSGDDGPGTALLVSGIVVTSLGAVGLGVGAAFMVIAKGKDDDSLGFCQPDDPALCSQEGVDLRDDALSAQTIGVVGLVTGGVLTATGVALIAASYLGDDDPKDVAVVPWITPDGVGFLGSVAF